MNKISKIIISSLFLIAILVNILTLTSYAAGADIIPPDDVIDHIRDNLDTPGDTAIKKANVILGTIQVIGTVISIIAIIVIGIRYMTGSVESKAEYKKVMIPYIAGAALIFGISNIVPTIYNIAKGLE